MDRYLILDTQENVVATTNQLEFPSINDGGSVACNDIYEAITEMEVALVDLREIVKKRESESTSKCSWCGDEFEQSELKETSMGQMCDRCVRGVESREGKI